ncbi:helix-turn-helix transcriptional regulator [Mesorhizobium caraganae]|uniref:helix-turn-helix transcriptional regulator n=1 Tax=Mesorhizobium caraganae TaxID=483206 RepID=UPI003ECC9588
MSNTETFLTAPQVQKRYNITDMTLWRWLKDPELAFPQPTVINRRRYFLEADLSAWERQRAGRAA